MTTASRAQLGCAIVIGSSQELPLREEKPEDYSGFFVPRTMISVRGWLSRGEPGESPGLSSLRLTGGGAEGIRTPFSLVVEPGAFPLSYGPTAAVEHMFCVSTSVLWD